MLSRTSRTLLTAGAVLLVTLYVLPLWRIDLFAPQYPEGLGMLIRLSTIEGVKEYDLRNINALNHYIGMRTIDPAVIPELRIMPWAIAGLLVLGLAAAATGRRSLAVGWLAGLAAFGLAGMTDFWWWGYQYGHNLDPNAIIVVPGMTYQPPLIGSRQLLNFTAYSWPAPGALAAGASFALGLVAVLGKARVATDASARARPEVPPVVGVVA